MIRDRFRLLAAAATCLFLLPGCAGGDDPPAASTDEPPPSSQARSARPNAAQTQIEPSDPNPLPACVPDEVRQMQATSVDLVEARTAVDRAAVRRTREGGSFVTRLVLRRPPFTAIGTLRGRRLATGDSTGRLTWHGAARLLLPDATLAITGDQLRIRTDSDASFRPLGSASGVALDVGRELLDHPFLLDAVAARALDATLSVTLQPRIGELRTYATTERRGPVTELLRETQSALLRVTVDDGRLVRDHFAFTTLVPDSPPFPDALAGWRVSISGETVRCD